MRERTFKGCKFTKKRALEQQAAQIKQEDSVTSSSNRVAGSSLPEPSRVANADGSEPPLLPIVKTETGVHTPEQKVIFRGKRQISDFHALLAFLLPNYLPQNA